MAKKKASKKKVTTKKNRSDKVDDKKLKQQIIKLEQTAKAEMKKAKDIFMAKERKFKEYIKKNPEKAVAIAAGLGAAIGGVTGAVVARRRKKK